MIASATFSMTMTGYTKKSVTLAEEGDAYIVVFEKWRLPAKVEALIEKCGGKVLFTLPKIGVVVAMPVVDTATFEEKLGKKAGIVNFGLDYEVEVPDDTVILAEGSELTVESGPTVTDPYYHMFQWHLWHTIEASPSGAWQITTGNPDIKVAVLDTGVDYNHPDLAPNYDFALSKSFVDYYNGTVEDEMDYDGHGSHTAGIVAAAINNDPDDAKVVGVGPDLSLVNLKVLNRLGWGYFSWIMQAVYYAVEQGIDVISMSLGAYIPMPAEGAPALYAALQRLFNYANRNGVVSIASAGNAGADMDWAHPWVHLPSQSSSVIAVIGTDIYDDIAHTLWGSNYGSSLHGMSAPGGDGAFVEPEWYKPIIPPEYWQWWYGFVFSSYAWTATGYKYAWMAGTSMAAPHVAGVAGLILSVNPELTPSQVEYFLHKGAEDIGDPGYDQYFNFGLLNAYNSVLEVVTTNIRTGAQIVP